MKYRYCSIIMYVAYSDNGNGKVDRKKNVLVILLFQ